MAPLAELALRFPEVTLVLAHTALADQGMFASRLRDHPGVLYDTSCFSPFDLIELFARVPAERIVFASDVPYGRPVRGLYVAMRTALLAGLDADERALLAGGTMAAVLDGRPLPEARPPRLDTVRPVNGTMLRIAGYLMMGFGAAISGGERREVSRAAEAIALARGVCRDPDAGVDGSRDRPDRRDPGRGRAQLRRSRHGLDDPRGSPALRRRDRCDRAPLAVFAGDDPHELDLLAVPGVRVDDVGAGRAAEPRRLGLPHEDRRAL